MVKENICFQETIWKGTQVFHENYGKDEMLKKVLSYMETDFKQLEGQSMDSRLHVLVSKKGKMTVNLQRNKQMNLTEKPDMSHNRIKKYILKEEVQKDYILKSMHEEETERLREENKALQKAKTDLFRKMFGKTEK